MRQSYCFSLLLRSRKSVYELTALKAGAKKGWGCGGVIVIVIVIKIKDHTIELSSFFQPWWVWI